jgi:hypothetical protein
MAYCLMASVPFLASRFSPHPTFAREGMKGRVPGGTSNTLDLSRLNLFAPDSASKTGLLVKEVNRYHEKAEEIECEPN